MTDELESTDTPTDELASASSSRKAGSRRRWLVAGVMVAAVAAVATLLSLAGGRDTALARAHDECHEDGLTGLSLADDDRTLVVTWSYHPDTGLDVLVVEN